VDIDDEALERAKEGKADHTINTKSNPDFLSQILELSSGGLHAVAVFAAVKEGVDIAPRMLRTRGKLIVVGCPPTEVSFNVTEIAIEKIQYPWRQQSRHERPPPRVCGIDPET